MIYLKVSQRTPFVRNLDFSRQEEHALQVDVATPFQNNLARSAIRGREYEVWERLSAALGAHKKCASDISQDPIFLRPTITIHLTLYLAQSTIIIDLHITVLLLEKNSFGVDIKYMYT